MKTQIILAVIYFSFFFAIAVACFVTTSGWPLLALILTPGFSIEVKTNQTE